MRLVIAVLAVAACDASSIVTDSDGYERSGRTTDPASFTRWTVGGTSAGGESQDYCVCDVGCCAPTQMHTIQLDAIESVAMIQWQGRTWSGPSDTNNPMGDFFQPGRYDVLVTFQGYAAGTVQAMLPIEIIP